MYIYLTYINIWEIIYYFQRTMASFDKSFDKSVYQLDTALSWNLTSPQKQTANHVGFYQ